MGKKNSVPKRQHQYVKRQKKFIEMPREQFIKICAIVAAVILAIVLAVVLIRAFDGHLSVVDGAIEGAGDNWLVTNTQTTDDPRYFKLGEAGEVPGFTREKDETISADANITGYRYTAEGATESDPYVHVYTSAVAYDTLTTNMHNSYVLNISNTTVGEIESIKIGDLNARRFSYEYFYENPVATAEGEEQSTETATETIYIRGINTAIDAGRGRTILVNTTASGTDQAAMPTASDMIASVDAVAAQITIG